MADTKNAIKMGKSTELYPLMDLNSYQKYRLITTKTL